MKFLLLLAVISITYQITVGRKIVCYYNTVSVNRVGLLKFTHKDLELALNFCTHIVYDHASFNTKSFQVTTVTAQREQELVNMEQFKRKYPRVKFILSIGGDKSVRTTSDFTRLLEADELLHISFVRSAVDIVRKYKFDGLSLDFRLPIERPTDSTTENGGTFANLWNSCKNFFHPQPKDETIIIYRKKLSDLIQMLRTSLRPDNRMLILNVLPNTNSKLFDVPTISQYLDFVILSAFDFSTPRLYPMEADYMAPIKPLDLIGHRTQRANVQYLVHQWLHQNVSRSKIVIGVATWGRSWKLTKYSQKNGVPPIIYADGPALGGELTHRAGFLSWLEICSKLSCSNPKNTQNKEHDLLRWPNSNSLKVEMGHYVFRPADENGNNGVWISYEDYETAAAKAQYVRNHNLGGIALIDLGLDDFSGKCGGYKFPILRSIRGTLLKSDMT